MVLVLTEIFHHVRNLRSFILDRYISYSMTVRVECWMFLMIYHFQQWLLLTSSLCGKISAYSINLRLLISIIHFPLGQFVMATVIDMLLLILRKSESESFFTSISISFEGRGLFFCIVCFSWKVLILMSQGAILSNF